jgi:mannose/fructose/N-acetylgalactosamine-specific phosphotransferase system component IIC
VSGGPWNALLCAAAAAVLELDAAMACQFMVSRPIVLGPLLGFFLGQPGLGAGLGVICELFTLEELPVGSWLPLNASVAVATALILSSGPAPVPPELALPVGLAAGLAHKRIEAVLRRRRAKLNALVAGRLERAEEPGLGRLALGELARQAATTFLLLAVLLACRGLVRGAWSASPDALRSGLRFGYAVAPWPGLWSLLRSFKVVS